LPDSRRLWETDAVAEGERFAFYREAICTAFMELVPDPPRRGRKHFFARVESVPLDAGAVNRVHAASHRVTRTPAEIAASDAACYYLNFQRGGECRIGQSAREVVLSPGQVGIFSSDRPFVLDHERRHELRVASFWVPEDALAARLPTGIPMKPARPSDDPAVGRLIAETARVLDESAGRLDPGDSVRLFDMLLDLVAMALSDDRRVRVDTPAALRGGLLLAIRRTIAERARDPALSVAAVAASHGITPRYVHKLFERDGTTFGDELMALRLDGAARDLRDPARVHEPVLSIALDWGFKDHAHFSRRFKDRFLATPRDWRRQDVI
jgi:AraC-like DNA-binding protein